MQLDFIGHNELVDFPELKFSGVPAKIDTGADSSAIWASSIKLDVKGVLSAVLFGNESQFFTGETI
ncbi:MAG: hypothetical protein ACREHG_06145, partial [Candidatus Saccharimonadales bacterium]